MPLVACNPLFSIWSNADHLTDDVTRHWTKKPHRLTSMIRVDGTPYRLMGDEPAAVEPLPQQGYATVLPTRSVYQFDGHGVHVTLTFLTPALPDDVAVLSRPLTYLTWRAVSTDGRPHAASVFFGASTAWPSTTRRRRSGGRGPTCRAWSPCGRGRRTSRTCSGTGTTAGSTGATPTWRPTRPPPAGGWRPRRRASTPSPTTGRCRRTTPARPVPVADGTPTLALTMDLGPVAADPVERRAMIAYDDVYAVDFFGRKTAGLLAARGHARRRAPAGRGRPAVRTTCSGGATAFDAALTADLTKVGGADYAYLCSLAYRQAVAGCGIAADATASR